jgi:DNA mismatch endonuclease (patch repair protein)
MNRSEIMAAVKSKNTRPELLVRRILFALGYRYRLHSATLPGHPDIVFSSRRKVVFVHGCFWHGHDCRAGRNRPASNLAYWSSKLTRNVTRDRRNVTRLKKDGWALLVLWECELQDTEKLKARLRAFLGKTTLKRRSS